METTQHSSTRCKIPPKDLTAGIALSSGGALGLSHIGVLNAFTSAGIRFPVIAGTSIGAIVGAAYACGTLKLAEEMALSITRQDMLRWVDLHWNGGLLKGDAVERILRKLTDNLTFEDLRGNGIDLIIVACDLNAGKPVYISEGDIARAVRASMSIPGVFVPVELNGDTLVDGGLVDGIPVSILEKLGAGFTVGVDVSSANDMWHRAKLGFVASARTADQLWERVREISTGAANAGSRQWEKYQEAVRRFVAGTLGVSAADAPDVSDWEISNRDAAASRQVASDPGRTSTNDTSQASSRYISRAANNGSTQDLAGIRSILQSTSILTRKFHVEQQGCGSIPKADILLKPDIRPYHAHQFYKAKELIEAGRKAAEQALGCCWDEIIPE
ncbi:MAG TPA: patatin-like phospholipase family protein [Firmicutes bacterium]|nr:patatin-like phospholipase family protein [Candidatus Fermentithermobacillaceae bacterium]